jgi:hypothetical protein
MSPLLMLLLVFLYMETETKMQTLVVAIAPSVLYVVPSL